MISTCNPSREGKSDHHCLPLQMAHSAMKTLTNLSRGPASYIYPTKASTREWSPAPRSNPTAQDQPTWSWLCPRCPAPCLACPWVPQGPRGPTASSCGAFFASFPFQKTWDVTRAVMQHTKIGGLTAWQVKRWVTQGQEHTGPFNCTSPAVTAGLGGAGEGKSGASYSHRVGPWSKLIPWTTPTVRGSACSPCQGAREPAWKQVTSWATKDSEASRVAAFGLYHHLHPSSLHRSFGFREPAVVSTVQE